METAPLQDEHIWLWEDYRLSGGVVTPHDLMEELARRRMSHRVGALTRWLREGELVKFTVDESVWVPRFQFTREYALFDAVAQTIAELRPITRTCRSPLVLQQQPLAAGRSGPGISCSRPLPPLSLLRGRGDSPVTAPLTQWRSLGRSRQARATRPACTCSQLARCRPGRHRLPRRWDGQAASARARGPCCPRASICRP